jgi:exo-poly-alpha-galacturonosidase
VKKQLKHTLSGLALALALSPALSVSANPSAPQNLTVPVLAYDSTSLSLTWEKPPNYNDISFYNIYMNNKRIGNTKEAPATAAAEHIHAFYAAADNQRAEKISLHNYTVKSLQPNTSYSFTVRSVDAQGKESSDSKSIVQKTAALSPIYNVADYGAVGDGITMNTKSIQRAIDACQKGGTVLIPSGTYKSGALWLHSNMTLEVARGGILLGSEDPATYPFNYKLYSYSDDRYYALINASSTDDVPIENIRIIGSGTIDGNGWTKTETGSYSKANNKADKNGVYDPNHVLNIGILAKSQVEKLMASGMTFNQAYPRRSNLITLRGVKNIYYGGGLTFQNPANHTIVNVKCHNITVNNATIKTFDCNNGDGIESVLSNGLVVMNNYFDTGDDGMNFAAGMGADAAKEQPTSNSWIFNNYFHHGHGAIVIGSHTGAWIEKILAEDNIMEKTDIGFRAKTTPPMGGGARNILFRNNALKDIEQQAFIFTSGYFDPNSVIEYKKAASPGQFKNITIENCSIDKTGGSCITVQGLAEMPHKDLAFRNLHFYNVKPMEINYLENGTFYNVVFDKDNPPTK